MNKTLKTLLAVLILVGLLVSFKFKIYQALGSVNIASEYQSTSTLAMANQDNVITTSSSVVGSIIVSSSSATSFKICNATSSTDIASTTIAHFKASPDNKTYTLDVVAPRGIIVKTPPGFNGNYTITYR
jgi:hypothetical protein